MGARIRTPSDITVIVRAVLLIVLVVGTTACASSGAVPHPFPIPSGPPAAAAPPPVVPDPPVATRTDPTPIVIAPADADGEGYALAGTALSLRGAPYRNYGADPSGFDCSGFVQYVFKQYGRALPREVREQFRVGKQIARDRLEPGDLVFFTTVSSGASHVGIAIGGDQFVHAPSSTGVVRVERLSSSYWSPRFLGARRMN